MSGRPEADLAWARWAVARWDGFPVTRRPRPLVLLGEAAHARNGFRSQRAKRAFMLGWIETRVTVPEAVLAIAGRRTDRPEGEPPIVITAARRAQVEQATDRGPRWLAGWELTSDQTLGPIVVLDPDVLTRAWRPEEPGHPPPEGAGPGHSPVSGEAEGHTLTIRFVGPAPNQARYRSAEVIETATAVAIVPRLDDIGPPGPRTAAGYARRVSATLREPLGARVLVDLHGHPCAVTAR